jgi:hypothetical protein
MSRKASIRAALAAVAMLGVFSAFGPATAGPSDPSCQHHYDACKVGPSVHPNWKNLGWSLAKCTRSFQDCNRSCAQQPNSGGWPGWDGNGVYPASCPMSLKAPKKA